MLIEESVRASDLTKSRLILTDQAYRGDLEDLIPLRFGLDFEISSKPTGKGFIPIPKRWVIERSNAWMSAIRRAERDRETNPASSKAWAYLANISIALGKLQKTQL